MALSILRSALSRKKNAIGSLTIEATLSENHEARSQVTQQPVELGSNISDHIINEPDRVSITGFISNTPVAGGFSNRAQDAFEALYAIRDAKELVTVVTGYRVYNNMAISSISIPRDQFTGESIRFTVELIEVRTSASNSVSVFGQILSPAAGFASQAQSRLNLGRQSAVNAGSAAVSKATNVLRGLF